MHFYVRTSRIVEVTEFGLGSSLTVSLSGKRKVQRYGRSLICGLSSRVVKPHCYRSNLRYDGNAARLALRSDEALGMRVSVARHEELMHLAKTSIVCVPGGQEAALRPIHDCARLLFHVWHTGGAGRTMKLNNVDLLVSAQGSCSVTTKTLYALSVGAMRRWKRALVSPVSLPRFLTLDAQLHSTLNEHEVFSACLLKKILPSSILILPLIPPSEAKANKDIIGVQTHKNRPGAPVRARSCRQLSPGACDSRLTVTVSPWRVACLECDKIDFKRLYTEVTFAIGSKFIRHALDESTPIADLQRNTKRIPRCQMWRNTGPMNKHLSLLDPSANSRLARKHLANTITARCGATIIEHTAGDPICIGLRMPYVAPPGIKYLPKVSSQQHSSLDDGLSSGVDGGSRAAGSPRPGVSRAAPPAAAGKMAPRASSALSLYTTPQTSCSIPQGLLLKTEFQLAEVAPRLAAPRRWAALAGTVVIGSYLIWHALGNSAPVNEHFTTVCTNHVQFSQKGRGFSSMQRPMEKRRWLQYRKYCRYDFKGCSKWPVLCELKDIVCDPEVSLDVETKQFLGIVPDNAAGRQRVFPGISRSYSPCIPALLHIYSLHPSALKTAFRAAQTSPLHFIFLQSVNNGGRLPREYAYYISSKQVPLETRVVAGIFLVDDGFFRLDLFWQFDMSYNLLHHIVQVAADVHCLARGVYDDKSIHYAFEGYLCLRQPELIGFAGPDDCSPWWWWELTSAKIELAGTAAATHRRFTGELAFMAQLTVAETIGQSTEPVHKKCRWHSSYCRRRCSGRKRRNPAFHSIVGDHQPEKYMIVEDRLGLMQSIVEDQCGLAQIIVQERCKMLLSIVDDLSGLVRRTVDYWCELARRIVEDSCGGLLRIAPSGMSDKTRVEGFRTPMNRAEDYRPRPSRSSVGGTQPQPRYVMHGSQLSSFNVPECTTLQWCSVAHSLGSSPGDPGSIPGRITPDFRMWETCRTMPLVGEFSRGSPVFPALSFQRYSILIFITLIGSQDLDVKSHPHLFTLFTRRHFLVRTVTTNALRVPGVFPNGVLPNDGFPTAFCLMTFCLTAIYLPAICLTANPLKANCLNENGLTAFCLTAFSLTAFCLKCYFHEITAFCLTAFYLTVFCLTAFCLMTFCLKYENCISPNGGSPNDVLPNGFLPNGGSNESGIKYRSNIMEAREVIGREVSETVSCCSVAVLDRDACVKVPSHSQPAADVSSLFSNQTLKITLSVVDLRVCEAEDYPGSRPLAGLQKSSKVAVNGLYWKYSACDESSARSKSRSEGAIRATLTRTASTSSLLRARRAMFPS
ncbi:hypothetical protein PR048_028151 [Dryococelus australis]|uniref:Uncharacterized protein n=1 Tax=Dryococelus australis TaxID=614101 RepID=A0ABQ9GIG9_9NEOP|nr:hypothetical protein PR048_028151 [Dryococelus australis]